MINRVAAFELLNIAIILWIPNFSID